MISVLDPKREVGLWHSILTVSVFFEVLSVFGLACFSVPHFHHLYWSGLHCRWRKSLFCSCEEGSLQF